MLGGYHATADTRWREEHQESLCQNQFKMLSTIGGLRGLTPWILVDFRATRRQHPVCQNGWNRKDLILSDGQKKKAYFVVQDYYRHKAQQYERK